MSAGLLEAVDVSKHFGGVHALRNVSMRLREGDVIGLIGPNGSGKTTFLNCLSGVFPPTGGRVDLDGRPIPKRGHAVARWNTLHVRRGRRVLRLALPGRLRTGWYGVELRVGTLPDAIAAGGSVRIPCGRR